MTLFYSCQIHRRTPDDQKKKEINSSGLSAFRISSIFFFCRFGGGTMASVDNKTYY